MTLLTYLLNLPHHLDLSLESYFNLSGQDREQYRDDILRRFPLLYCAGLNWQDRLQDRVKLQDDFTVRDLVLQLFKASAYQMLDSIQLMFNTSEDGYCYHFEPSDNSEFSLATAELCMFGLPGIAEHLLQQNNDVSALEAKLKPCNNHIKYFDCTEDVEGTPLQIASMMVDTDFVELLLRYGPNPNARCGSWTVLTLALRNRNDPYYDEGYRRVIECLLKEGASVKPEALCKTPLQIAVERKHSSDIIQTLIDEM